MLAASLHYTSPDIMTKASHDAVARRVVAAEEEEARHPQPTTRTGAAGVRRAASHQLVQLSSARLTSSSHLVGRLG